MSYRVICALGDSITNGYWDEEGLGWFTRLAMRLSKDYPYQYGFNNLAQSGDRCTDMLNKLRGEALQRTPDVLLIACGVNDVIRWGNPDAPMDISEGLRLEMWQQILTLAKKNIAHVAVISLLPVIEAHLPSPGLNDRPLWYLNKDIAVYNDQLRSWCAESGVAFLDIMPGWRGLRLEDYIYDAVHPNAKGHQLMADQVLQQLKSAGIMS